MVVLAPLPLLQFLQLQQGYGLLHQVLYLVLECLQHFVLQCLRTSMQAKRLSILLTAAALFLGERSLLVPLPTVCNIPPQLLPAVFRWLQVVQHPA